MPSKESTVVGYANIPTNTVVVSDCGTVNNDHCGDPPARCVVEHTHATEPTEFADHGIYTPALDAVESAGGCEVTRADVLLTPLSWMKELLQLE
ncbi:hypothetical protein Plhal710r2_c048g0152871 [Plasmopara halstedii]